jgi:hypothetical protein
MVRDSSIKERLETCVKMIDELLFLSSLHDVVVFIGMSWNERLRTSFDDYQTMLKSYLETKFIEANETNDYRELETVLNFIEAEGKECQIALDKIHAWEFEPF